LAGAIELEGSPSAAVSFGVLFLALLLAMALAAILSRMTEADYGSESATEVPNL
jgi:hypothetical protein